MKAKLKPNICYIAGLTRRALDKNAVGIETGIGEIAQRFAEIAVKELKVLPSKILVEERDGRRLVYFYHSRVARQLEEIRSREDKLFKAPTEFSINYLAGIVDASGRFSKQGIYIDGLTPQDEVMLANLGIHTRNGRVSNISTLLELVKGKSVIVRNQK